MHELESMYRITYISWMGYYVVHTPNGEVCFYKDEQGLPYLTWIWAEPTLLTHLRCCNAKKQERRFHVSLVQTVHGNYEG